MNARPQLVERIATALEQARLVALRYAPETVHTEEKSPGDPVTEADLALDELLRRTLPRDGEGWLSEETADTAERLDCDRVWVVDPLDGTREFVAGVPEWCVSIGYVERGRAVAGGICNPASGQTVVGAVGHGVWLDDRPVRASAEATLDGADVVASRSETGRGEWRRWDAEPFRVRAVGSVAYKLGLVAAGLADATWTLTPKHEWDVAAGVALVVAAGGRAWLPAGGEPRFNRPSPKLAGLAACAPGLVDSIQPMLRAALRAPGD